jgi:predicted phage terminase large subunit-like protein
LPKVELAKRFLIDFYQVANPTYQLTWFHRLILSKLQLFFEGKIQNLMINIPPQHGKSDCTKSAIAWGFGINPNNRLSYSSYNYSLAGKANRQIQRIIESDYYKNIFPQTTLNDRNIRTDVSSSYIKNSDEFEIVGHKGGFISVGVGGGLTGNPVDKAIIDDPFKDRMEAESVTIRDNIWEWYINVLCTRLHNSSQKLLINTRWNEDDLSGRILKLVDSGDLNENWEVIKIEGIKTESVNIESDTRTIGEALWESQHSLKKLLDVKRMDAYAFECLYQQNPQPKEGLLYSAFKTYTTLPPYTIVKNVTDPADAGECYTCSICYVVYMQQIYITDILYLQNKDTERDLATMLFQNNINLAEIEANNIGRIYTKNVKDMLTREYRSNYTTLNNYTTKLNKDAKIFANATWINENIFFPENWQVRWLQFANHLANYPANGKTKWKDGADVLSEMAMRMNKANRNVNYGS